jgi:hypothetical protein
MVCVGIVAWAGLFASTTLAETHSEIQSVDVSGNAIHPKVIRPGNPWSLDKQVVMEGVVVVAPYELTDTATELLIAFQGEGTDHAGTQIWTGAFFQDWPEPYDAYFGLLPGDRIRVTGYAAQFVGKTNINEQHSDDPAKDFTIEVLGHPGMPTPQVVPSVAVAKIFDATRATGGEYFQNRWVRMNNLTITTPATWQAGEEVTVTDGVDSMQMMLSTVGDFSSFAAPAGPFDVVALFDQEPRPLDFAASRMAHYRLWVKKMAHILPPGAPFLVNAVSRMTHAGAGAFDIDVSVPGAIEMRRQGPSHLLLVVTFDRPVTGVGGLDPTDVSVSSGTVTVASVDGDVLSISLVGVANAANLTVAFPGIVSVATVTPVSQSLCFGFLVGDVNRNRVVNSLDILGVRGRLNQTTTAANFMYDVAVNGSINSLDILAVRGSLGKSLAASCP